MEWVIAGLGWTLLASLLILLHRRQLLGRLPVLAVYVSLTLLGSLGTYYAILYCSDVTYAWYYYSKEGVIFVLSFLLIFSFWREAVARFRGVWYFLRFALPVALLALLGFIRWNAAKPGGDRHHLLGWVSDGLALMSESLALTQVVFLVGLFLVVDLFQIPVAALVRRLAACWFFFSLLKFALFATRYFQGFQVQALYRYGVTVSFVGLLAAWCAVLWAAAPDDLETQPPLAIAQVSAGRLPHYLEDLNRELERLVSK